jgi:hypothetical protein
MIGICVSPMTVMLFGYAMPSAEMLNAEQTPRTHVAFGTRLMTSPLQCC